jgi:hypothetical protein
MKARKIPSWFTVAVLIAIGAGCGSSSDNYYPPEKRLTGEYAVYGAELESASAEWGLDIMPMHTATVVAGIPSLGDCQLRMDPGNIPSPANSTGCQCPGGLGMSLDCVVTSEVMASPRWRVDISGLGDARTWPVGDVVPPTAYVGEDYPSYVADSRGCQRARNTMGAATGLRIVVEEAVGGIADYPQVVTPDYRRVFRVELDLNETLASQEGGTCGITATMKLSARFVQNSWNFQAIEIQPCFSAPGCG